MTRKIGIVDYGAGNLSSVCGAMRCLRFIPIVSSDQVILSQCDVIILPGVGSFSTAVDNLEYYGLIDFLRIWAHESRPLIGICLGMQLLATTGSEGRPTAGLDLIPGEVTRLPSGKVHVGWNTLGFKDQNKKFSALNGTDVYFNHSYEFQAAADSVLATTYYNGQISAIVRSGSIVGLQFHPEKSQTAGLCVLRTLIDDF